MTIIAVSRRSIFSPPPSPHRSRTKTVAVSSLSDACRESALKEWVVKEGGTVEAVSVSRSERQGWSLQAASDIPHGTRLISLPSACQLTLGKSEEQKLLEIVDKVPEEFWAAKLCLKLLTERLKGGRSQFWPYLQTLPQGVPGIPLFYSEAAVRALEYPPMIEQVKRRCRWLMNVPPEDRIQLRDLAGNEDVIPDTNLLGWSLAVVSSRAFRVHGRSRPASLLPLIDLCNHSFDPNCEVVPSKKKRSNEVNLVSTHNISAGEALVINYGDLSNDDLLLDYGFVIQDNPHDCVLLTFDPESITATKERIANITSDKRSEAEKVAVREWQQKMLKQLRFLGSNTVPFIKIGRGSEPLDPRFIAGVRVVTTDTIPQESSMEDLGSLDYSMDDVTELASLRVMAATLVLALSQFSTDIHSDRDLLESGRLSDPNEVLSYAFRIEKKELLLQAVQHIASKIRKTEQGK